MTRCNHRGSACIHRKYPMQAYKVGPEPATWADVAEIVGGTAIFLVLFIGIPFVLWLVAS